MIPPREFIRKLRPFSFLSEDELDIIIAGLEVESFRKDRIIFEGGEVRKNIYIVFSGLVCLFDEEEVDYISRGEIFGLMVSDSNEFLLSARVVEDTVCFIINIERYRDVLTNKNFSAFFHGITTRRFRSLKATLSDEKIAQETALVINVERLIYKKPVVCAPSTTAGGAAALMDAENVSSIIAVDENFKPAGILTHKDLRKVLINGSKSSSVSEFMSSPVKTIASSATIFEAFAKLTELGIDHLVVLKGDNLLGMITRKDIQIHLEPSFSIFSLYRKVSRADSLDALRTIFDSIRISAAKIALAGLHFVDMTKMISTVNDAIIVKTIELLNGANGRTDFVWINAGSSGRREEIIATDQDNAVIYRGERPSDLSEEVCKWLNIVGVPVCPGNFMASNDMWNQEVAAWKDYFTSWFYNPIPAHVRYLSVFLDMRPVYGDFGLYREVVESIGAHVTEEAVRSLVSDAVDVEIPLGLFGIRGLRRGLDIKMYGVYPIVNGIRALALDGGFYEITNTLERLDKLCRAGIIGETLSHDLLEAYGFLQDLRLRHHAGSVLRETPIDNLINTREISRLDLIILKESLKVVSSFRKFLMKKFDMSHVFHLREL